MQATQIDPANAGALTSEQFELIAALARLGNRSAECHSKTAAQLFYVDGLTISEAAKLTKVKHPTARKACLKVAAALDSIKLFHLAAA